MWNVFDTSFVVITLLYFVLRLRGLASGNRELYLASCFDIPPHQVDRGSRQLLLLTWVLISSHVEPASSSQGSVLTL